MKKDLYKGKTFFIVAIGGNGLQPLAILLNHYGAKVIGSDYAYDQGQDLKGKAELESYGIEIFPQDGSGITNNIDAIITNRVALQSPDVLKANELNIPVKVRNKFLGKFSDNFRLTSVAGTAGKTTTTAMIGHILKVNQKDPTVLNGSEMANYNSRLIIGNSDILAAEVCESGAAYTDKGDYALTAEITAEVGCITNIGHDHFDTLKEAQNVFEDYAANNVKGLLILNQDDENSAHILNVKTEAKIKTFGFSKKSDYIISNVKSTIKGITFQVNDKDVFMPQIGTHNALNATTAIAMSSHFDISIDDAIKALSTFKGAKQRLTITGEKNGITSICDFAHTPEELECSIIALKEVYSRIFFMYQPHGMVSHGHMKHKMPEIFNNILRKDDILYLMDTYAKTSEFESSKIVADKIDNCKFLDKKENLTKLLPNDLREGDCIVIVGARDLTLFPFAETILDTI